MKTGKPDQIAFLGLCSALPFVVLAGWVSSGGIPYVNALHCTSETADFWCTLYAWQTLCAGLLALLGAVGAWLLTRRQIQQAEKHFDATEYKQLRRRLRSMGWLHNLALAHLNQIREGTSPVLESATIGDLKETFEGVCPRALPRFCETSDELSLIVRMRINEANYVVEGQLDIRKLLWGEQDNSRPIPDAFKEKVKEIIKRRDDGLALLINGLIDDLDEAEQRLELLEKRHGFEPM